jgi:hypothetical protein
VKRWELVAMVSMALTLQNSFGGGRGKGRAVSVHLTVLLRASHSFPQIILRLCRGASPILSFIRSSLWTVRSSVISTAVAQVATVFVLAVGRWFVAGVAIPIVARVSSPRGAFTPPPSSISLSESLAGTGTHTIWGEKYGSQILEVGEIIEAYMFLVGDSESGSTVELDDAFMMGRLDSGKKLGDISFPGKVLAPPGW